MFVCLLFFLFLFFFSWTPHGKICIKIKVRIPNVKSGCSSRSYSKLILIFIKTNIHIMFYLVLEPDADTEATAQNITILELGKKNQRKNKNHSNGGKKWRWLAEVLAGKIFCGMSIKRTENLTRENVAITLQTKTIWHWCSGAAALNTPLMAIRCRGWSHHHQRWVFGSYNNLFTLTLMLC